MNQYRGFLSFPVEGYFNINTNPDPTEICPMVLRSGGKYSPNDTVSHPRKLEF